MERPDPGKQATESKRPERDGISERDRSFIKGIIRLQREQMRLLDDLVEYQRSHVGTLPEDFTALLKNQWRRTASIGGEHFHLIMRQYGIGPLVFDAIFKEHAEESAEESR